MTDLSQTSSIPEDAEEIRESFGPESLRTYRCVLNGQTVGSRTRDEEGRLISEIPLKNGLRHGVEREWDADGSLLFETYYVDGLEDGVAKQYLDGRLIGTYRMDHGTGVDLWRSHDGTLSEERWMKDGYRDGFERWWNGDNHTVRNESHFKRGMEHGIFRQWNKQGRLQRGYPQYYVDGTRVQKRQYLKACATDPSLPPFHEGENRPSRKLPVEYIDQLAEAQT
jgi:hypothetical protein